jgi:hypothetical protein
VLCSAFLEQSIPKQAKPKQSLVERFCCVKNLFFITIKSINIFACLLFCLLFVCHNSAMQLILIALTESLI